MRLINSDGQITDARVIAQDGGNAAHASVGSNVLLSPLIILLCVLVGLSLGLSLWALQRAETAEKQALVAKLRTEGFTRALIAKGIDPYPHLEGEDP
jgi:hypothetical protein